MLETSHFTRFFLAKFTCTSLYILATCIHAILTFTQFIAPFLISSFTLSLFSQTTLRSPFVNQMCGDSDATLYTSCEISAFNYDCSIRHEFGRGLLVY